MKRIMMMMMMMIRVSIIIDVLYFKLHLLICG